MLRLIELKLSRAINRSIIFVVTCVALISGASAQLESSGLRGMAIVPVMYRAAGHAGMLLKLPITVQNLDPHPAKITLRICPVTYTDWTYGADTKTKTKFDCSDWFAKKDFAATVKEASHFEFPMQCLVPKGTTPGVYYCLGIIEPTPDPTDRNIHAQYQIPIIIFVGKQEKLDLQFGSPTLDLTEKTGTINVPFINGSDAFTVVGANVQLRDAVTGRIIATKGDADRNLYPETKRTLQFGVGPLPDGQYLLRCVCQAGFRTFRPITASFVVVKGKAVAATPGTVISLPPFTVDPGRIHEKLPPGSRRVMVVKFTNQTDKQITIAVTAHRLTQASNGLLQVLEDSPLAPLSIQLTPDTLTLMPRRMATLRVLVSLDAGATGDSWFAISAVSTAGDSMSEEVYGSVNVPKTDAPKLEIVSKNVGLSDGVPTSVEYEVTNTGNIALKPLISASVLEGGLTPVARLDVPLLDDGEILPGSTLHGKLLLPLDLKPGAYAVRVEYQYAESATHDPVSEIKLIPFNVPKEKKKSPPAKKGGRSGSSS